MLDKVAVDSDIAEFVDDEGEAPSAGIGQRWRISVVLPAPRKPVTMVTGVLASMECRSLGWRRSSGGERRRPRYDAPAK